MRSSLTLIVWCALSGGLARAAEPLAYWPMDAIQDGVVADASGHGHEARATGWTASCPRSCRAWPATA